MQTIIPEVTGLVAGNEGEYQDYIDENPNSFSSPATQAEVQAMVNAVNTAVTESNNVLAQIGNEGDDPDTVNSVVTVAQMQTIIPEVTGLVAGNEGEYQDYIDENPNSFSSPATQAEVQAMVTAVNTAVTESNNVLAQIGNEGDDPDTVPSVVTVAQLETILPEISDLVAEYETAYQAYIDANPELFAAPATQAEVQAMVNAVNASQDLLILIGADEDDAGATTTNATAEELNAIIGVSGAITANEAAYQAYIDANANNFSNPATAAEVQIMINEINGIAEIVVNSNDPADGNPSIANLEEVGVENLNPNNQDVYEEAIANASPAPVTLEELQDIINEVNNGEVLSASTINEGDIATAFTPNGDGINDGWVIKNIQNFPNSVVKVYNRTGHGVFGAQGYQNDWEGVYNDNREKLPPGSYYFVINLGDGSAPMDGWIFINY